MGDDKRHKKRTHRDQVEDDYANDIPLLMKSSLNHMQERSSRLQSAARLDWRLPTTKEPINTRLNSKSKQEVTIDGTSLEMFTCLSPLFWDR